MGECGKAVLDGQYFSDQDRDRGDLYKLSESSGFGGTMCAGISISGVLALSEEVIGSPPTKTDHYQTNFPSGTLVFRSCLTPSGHSRSCVGSRKSNPGKCAQGREIYHIRRGAYSHIERDARRTGTANSYYCILWERSASAAVQLSPTSDVPPSMVTSNQGTQSSSRPASCRTDRYQIGHLRDPSSPSRLGHILSGHSSCPLECLNSNTYGVPIAN